jgi:hypothetical protein
MPAIALRRSFIPPRRCQDTGFLTRVVLSVLFSAAFLNRPEARVGIRQRESSFQAIAAQMRRRNGEHFFVGRND